MSLGQRAEQHQLLLPRMIQAIEALELPAGELAAWLREAYQQNEALRLVEPPFQRAGGAEASERHSEWLDSQATARSIDLSQALLEQLPWLDLAPQREAWVRFLILCLDEHGLLTLPDGELLELAESTGLVGGESALGLAIADLQRFEPKGLGGRDRSEALLLQLDPEEPGYALLAQLIEEFLADLERNKLPQVARALGIGLEELGVLLQRLRQLHPDPVAAWNQEACAGLEPDLFVAPSGEGFELVVGKGRVPELSVDPRVQRLASDRHQSREVRDHLRQRLERARWVIDAVVQREATLTRVARAVFEHQTEFLRSGPEHIRALTMASVAGELGLNPSTVSRAVAHKHVQTPFGILALRVFFQAEFKAGSDQERPRIQALLERLIAGEDKSDPLSDDQLVEALDAEGLQVARRTVAKYRTELGLPSSYRRRRFDARAG